MQTDIKCKQTTLVAGIQVYVALLDAAMTQSLVTP